MAHKIYCAVKFLLSPQYFSARYLRNYPKFPDKSFPPPKPLNPKPPKRERILKPHEAMSAIRVEENPDNLVKIFKKVSDEPRFHRHRSAYAIAVKKLARAGRHDAVEEILEHEKNKIHLNSNEGFMVRIITLYGLAGMPYQAVKTFRQLPQPGVKSLNALLNAVQQTENHEQVRDLYHEIISSYNLKPNLNTFNIVIKSLCEMGISEIAFLMLDEVGKHGCSPDVEIFNTILRGFYKEGKAQDVPRVLEKMSQIGCCPDVNTFNIRVLNLCREGRSYEATELLSGMRLQGVKPNAWSYNMVINGFCKEHNLVEAYKVFQSMAGKGCDPDSQSYFSLVYYLCVEQEFEWALEVCEESFRKNWIPNVSILQMLVEGLIKVSKVAEARRFLAEVRFRVSRDRIEPLSKIEAKLFRCCSL
ncbi:small ribosomal subunit protein mS86 (rPPR1) [Cryptomeria japonica]|uniref:small ribosomal subunit protein mS86 (rPPR1) n=1 Tax=Cryptomeria japonica TaxID=3369 RepID=UPI0027DA4453|nr:small ribosomal subunit protein mS86 (rPPR1) [Cryptomeria japonica]